jgi:hypothetical protein
MGFAFQPPRGTMGRGEAGFRAYLETLNRWLALYILFPTAGSGP